MDLREIGTMLREERERQGLSLDTVSDKIKISRSCLAAIEEGNESVLPHPVYAKGFIKNYAKLLGLDQGEFATQLAGLYQLDEPGQFRDISLTADIPGDDGGCFVPTPAPRPPVKLLVLGAALLLLVVGIVWFVLAHVFSTPEGEAPVAPVASGDTAAPAPAAAPEPAPAASVLPAPAPVVTAPAPVAVTPTVPAPPGVGPTPAEPAKTAQDVSPRGAPTLEDKATQDIAVSGPTAPVPAVPPAPETAPAPATPAAKTFTVGESGPHVVSIVANERCWLQAGADGGSMHETMLEKGDAFTGRFTDYLLVRLGNAGAVEIHFDNKLYPLQAGKGSVKTLKFVAKKTDAPQTAPAAAAPTLPPATPTAPVAAAPAALIPTPTAPALPPVAASVPAAEATPGGKEVEIYGQDGSWVIVSPDKAPSKEIYVKKGQRISVPFGEKIEIKLGNPSSVVFRYDGKETPVVTEKGASKTIRFP
jgi:cytoskeleton protein RodZ